MSSKRCMTTGRAGYKIAGNCSNKRTECEPSQFGSSREHNAAANAASKGPPTFLCGF